jgi:hypothetical protein
MGQGVGPVFMGWVSDLNARRAFGLGDYHHLCPAAPHASAEVAAACARASTVGLQHSSIVVSGFYILAAAIYLIASRSLKRDVESKL